MYISGLQTNRQTYVDESDAVIADKIRYVFAQAFDDENFDEKGDEAVSFFSAIASSESDADSLDW